MAWAIASKLLPLPEANTANFTLTNLRCLSTNPNKKRRHKFIPIQESV